MEPTKDQELRTALEALRPEPRPDFAAELDARAAAGFPRRPRRRALSPAAMFDRLRTLKPRQVLLPAGAVALTAIMVATVVVSQNSGEVELNVATDSSPLKERLSSPAAGSGVGQSAPVNKSSSSESEARGGTVFESEAPTTGEAAAEPMSQVYDGGINRNSGNASGRTDRAIERSSQITLGTEPENVGKASSEVFDVVHDTRGVVLRSRTSDGSAAHAEAEFELLIPSGKLGDAMAAFSRIAEVRSRHEATTDITAPTVSVAEHLEDSRARIDSLLGQLAAAETEGERETVERELRGERSRAAALQASLDNLERRASLSRVSLRIVGGEGTSTDEGGAWGIGDALDDAGNILAVAAAVTLLALAVLGPIALIALLVWLARRTYLRRARQTALG